MIQRALFAILAVAIVSAAVVLQGQQSTTVITADVAHPAGRCLRRCCAFFEDINFGADGGLYPDRIKNRSFEFTEPLTRWHEILAVGAKGLSSPKGELDIRTEDPLNPSNPHYLRMRMYEPGLGLSNFGSRHRRREGRGVPLLRIRSERRTEGYPRQHNRREWA